MSILLGQTCFQQSCTTEKWPKHLNRKVEMLLGEVSFTNLEQFLDHLMPKVQKLLQQWRQVLQNRKIPTGTWFSSQYVEQWCLEFKLGIIIHYPHIPSNQKSLSNSSFSHTGFNWQVTGTGAAATEGFTIGLGSK